MTKEEIIKLMNQTLSQLNVIFCWAMDNDDSLLNRISVISLLLREVMEEMLKPCKNHPLVSVVHRVDKENYERHNKKKNHL